MEKKVRVKSKEKIEYLIEKNREYYANSESIPFEGDFGNLIVVTELQNRYYSRIPTEHRSNFYSIKETKNTDNIHFVCWIPKEFCEPNSCQIELNFDD